MVGMWFMRIYEVPLLYVKGGLFWQRLKRKDLSDGDDDDDDVKMLFAEDEG